MVGDYKLAPMQGCPLPEQVGSGLPDLLKSLVGADYLPVLYVGEQVVHGINHMLICRQTLATQGAPEHLVKMVVNQNRDDGTLVGRWTLVSIEQIV